MRVRVRMRVDSFPPIVHAKLPRLPPYELAHRREGHVQREHDIVAHNLVQVFRARTVLVAVPPSRRTGVEGRARGVGRRRTVRACHLVELGLHLRDNVSCRLMNTNTNAPYVRGSSISGHGETGSR